MGDAIGIRQQLSTTSFEAYEVETREHDELSCANLNGTCQFYAKSHKLIGAFLACPPD